MSGCSFLQPYPDIPYICSMRDNVRIGRFTPATTICGRGKFFEKGVSAHPHLCVSSHFRQCRLGPFKHLRSPSVPKIGFSPHFIDVARNPTFLSYLCMRSTICGNISIKNHCCYFSVTRCRKFNCNLLIYRVIIFYIC